MKIQATIFLFTLITIFPLTAQVKLSSSFLHLLEKASIDVLTPLDSDYKKIRNPKNDFLDCDFTIRSRKKRLEIRYLIEPIQNASSIHQIPHIQAMQKVIHLATNNQEARITALSISEDELSEYFNADWGKLFFFQPKASFSSTQHVKMLALFKEGYGMAYVFFLFDKPSQELDNRLYALRFQG